MSSTLPFYFIRNIKCPMRIGDLFLPGQLCDIPFYVEILHRQLYEGHSEFFVPDGFRRIGV